MSSAFVKEGEYEKLNEIEPSLSALSFFFAGKIAGGSSVKSGALTAKNAGGMCMK
jgi:hypothetical protein